MAHTNLKLYIFDREYCISRYYTIVAESELDALIALKAYLKVRAKGEKKGEDYHDEYYKWRNATIYDLPENYRIEEYDISKVLEHERI